MIHSADTSKFVRHVGTYNDKRCVVVIQLPEDPSNVHIVDTDSLPDLYHQNVMTILESPQGQSAKWLGEVLSRSMLYDGENAMRTLYEKGFIQIVPVDRVILTPLPNKPVALSAVLEQYNPNPIDSYTNALTDKNREYVDIAAREQAKLNESATQDDSALLHNQHVDNLASDKVEAALLIAKNLISEAELLEASAAVKRREAAIYNPALSVNESVSIKIEETGPFIDSVTGKSYKTEGALKGAITRRNKQA